MKEGEGGGGGYNPKPKKSIAAESLEHFASRNPDAINISSNVSLFQAGSSTMRAYLADLYSIENYGQVKPATAEYLENLRMEAARQVHQHS